MDFSIPFNKAWATYQKKFVDITVGYLLMLVVSMPFSLVVLCAAYEAESKQTR